MDFKAQEKVLVILGNQVGELKQVRFLIKVKGRVVEGTHDTRKLRKYYNISYCEVLYI